MQSLFFVTQPLGSEVVVVVFPLAALTAAPPAAQAAIKEQQNRATPEGIEDNA